MHEKYKTSGNNKKMDRHKEDRVWIAPLILVISLKYNSERRLRDVSQSKLTSRRANKRRIQIHKPLARAESTMFLSIRPACGAVTLILPAAGV